MVRDSDRFAEWAMRLAEDGLLVDLVQPEPGEPPPPGFAIGVTARFDDAIEPGRHTVVIRDGRLFFDPASGFLWPNGEEPARVRCVEFAITLSRKGEHTC
jgi:hypothetical protein